METYTAVLTVTAPDGQTKSRVHHVVAPNVELAAFWLGVESLKDYDRDHVITGVILFKGTHYDCLPKLEGDDG